MTWVAVGFGLVAVALLGLWWRQWRLEDRLESWLELEWTRAVKDHHESVTDAFRKSGG